MALENGMNNLDMTGKLIIKASLGDDIRRIPIHNDDLTYDELVLMMQRVFRGVLDPEEELLLKYKDEDGDLVTIMDNSDLSFAIQFCRVLRLTIILGVEGTKKTVAVGSAVTKELREIRDRVNKLIDMVSDSSKGPSDDVGGESSEGGVAEEVVGQVGQINQVENREFDPLGQEQVQQETPASTSTAEAVTAYTATNQTDTTSSFPAAASSGYQAPDLSSFTPTAAGNTGYQQPIGYPATSATIAPPSGTYPATTPSGGYQATTPSLAPPSSGYPAAPSLAPPGGYPATTASQAPPLSGYPATTGAHAPPTNNFPPQASGYQAPSSSTLPPSTPSNYPTANYPTQPPPNANYPRPSTPSTVPPTSYAYASPQPHFSPYHPPNYPQSPAGYPAQPPNSNPYSRGPPAPQQGYQHPGMGGQQQQQ